MRKFLTIGICFLLICSVFIPISLGYKFKTTEQHPISNNESIEDCGCNEVSDADLIKVKMLLKKVEVYSKLLLMLPKYSPEMSDNYDELSNMISTLNKFDLKEFICDWLFNIVNYIYNKWKYYAYEVIPKIPEDEIIKECIVAVIINTYQFMAIIIARIAVNLDCEFYLLL